MNGWRRMPAREFFCWIEVAKRRRIARLTDEARRRAGQGG